LCDQPIICESLRPKWLNATSREYVTVLCTELKESLERIARRDPEEALKIFKVVLPLMMQAFHQYDGTINEVTGDEIMALVGAPLTNEDHVHIAMSLLGARADARELPDLDVTADKADQSFKEKWNALLRYQGRPFDEEKWNALLRYDDAIANAAAEVRPFGDKWVDELARAYLTLEDKQYLPNILKNIISDANREADERQDNPKPERSQPVDQTNRILSRYQRWVSSWVVWLRRSCGADRERLRRLAQTLAGQEVSDA